MLERGPYNRLTHKIYTMVDFMNVEMRQFYLNWALMQENLTYMRITKTQTSLRICSVWSVPLFHFMVRMIFKLVACKVSISQLFSAVEETGLSLTWSETPKTGFLATKPKYTPDRRQSKNLILSRNVDEK